MVPACTWYGRPAMVRRCAHPSLAHFRDESVIECGPSPGVRFTCAVTRQTREHLGRRSRTRERPSVHSMTVRAPRIPGPGHDPSNRIIRPTGPGRGTADLIAHHHSPPHRSPPGSSGGRSSRSVSNRTSPTGSGRSPSASQRMRRRHAARRCPSPDGVALTRDAMAPRRLRRSGRLAPAWPSPARDGPPHAGPGRRARPWLPQPAPGRE
jgi:hypothetical protein